MKILLKIAYDGTNFCGFQYQPNARTVQSVLTETISGVMGFPCMVTGCSRTDSGVHATGFCAAISPADAHAEDWCRIPVAKLHRPLNERLPSDVSVLAAAVVPDDFHPRYSVHSKTYEYHIYDAFPRDPFREFRALHISPVADSAFESMECSAGCFVGRHDFASFMAAGSKITDTVRTVFRAGIVRESHDSIVFRVCADGFLYNMVRIIAGTLIDIGHGKLPPECLKTALSTLDRLDLGVTAPACGLELTEVRYPEESLNIPRK